ncbi:MAG TPA: ParB N-terminal domain-containing protein [Burkholderiaceae bacterium]|jgi:ParB/RepB/Spo0J family partition protein|nr:ParB N-terminal domain-containing protein [Burkholderiaceae bacterium]
MFVQTIRCDDIHPDPRSEGYRLAAIEALAEDVRSRGILRPVLLRETPGGYVIVHGERRWRAARLLGLPTIPAFVVQDFGRGDSEPARGMASRGAQSSDRARPPAP